MDRIFDGPLPEYAAFCKQDPSQAGTWNKYQMSSCFAASADSTEMGVTASYTITPTTAGGTCEC